MKPRLRDEMQQIVDHLEQGARLIGPVTVSRATGRSPRDWGFADGRRANKISVEALAARGLIRIETRGSKRKAVLVEPIITAKHPCEEIED